MKFKNFLLLFLVLLCGVYLEDCIPAIVRKSAFFLIVVLVISNIH